MPAQEEGQRLRRASNYPEHAGSRNGLFSVARRWFEEDRPAPHAPDRRNSSANYLSPPDAKLSTFSQAAEQARGKLNLIRQLTSDADEALLNIR